MLAKAETQQLDDVATRNDSTSGHNVLNTRIWLPALLYDGLPYFYLTAGFAAIFATLYIADWFWVLPYYLLFSAACLHLAYVVFQYRSRKSGAVFAGDTALPEPISESG